MQYWRCKCGKREVWESGETPALCETCPDCGSTLAQTPDGHQQSVPHDWITLYDQQTGAAYQTCRRCGQKGYEPLVEHDTPAPALPDVEAARKYVALTEERFDELYRAVLNAASIQIPSGREKAVRGWLETIRAEHAYALEAALAEQAAKLTQAEADTAALVGLAVAVNSLRAHSGVWVGSENETCRYCGATLDEGHYPTCVWGTVLSRLGNSDPHRKD